MNVHLTRRALMLGSAGLWLSLNTPHVLAQSGGWPGPSPTPPPFAPRKSDVCFSDRFGRMDSLKVAARYEANRLDWCYSFDKIFIAAARASGLRVVGGALNPTLSDTVGGSSTLRGRALDRQGRMITAPWQTWGSHWACINNPEYYDIFMAHARARLDAGVNYFQIDDGGFNIQARGWGGCFCKFCKEAADRERLSLDRDMLVLQQRSVVRFYDRMRRDIDRMAGRHVTLSSNNPIHQLSAGLRWPFKKTDFGMAELSAPRVKPALVRDILITTERAGAPQILTLPDSDRMLNRRLAAWCYANGGHMIVPYDVFVPNGKPRFMADPAEHADTFRFARSLGRLLDEAVPAGDLPKGSWTSTLPGFEASLRVSPRKSFAVLHLVNWGKEGATTLSLDPARLLPAGHRVRAARARIWQQKPVPLVMQGQRLTCNLPAATWIAVEMEVA